MRSGAADKEETFRKKAVPHRGNKYRGVTDPENERHVSPKGLGAYDLDMAYGLTKGPRRPTEAELLARDKRVLPKPRHNARSALVHGAVMLISDLRRCEVSRAATAQRLRTRQPGCRASSTYALSRP